MNIAELLSRFLELGNSYNQFTVAQIERYDDTFVKIGLGVFFTFLPFIALGTLAIILERISLKLSLLFPVSLLLSIILFASTFTYLIGHYVADFFVYPAGVLFALIIFAATAEVFDEFFLTLYALTKKNEFINFIGYHDIEHYTISKIVAEKKFEKMMEKEKNRNYDDYDYWYDKHKDPKYASFPGNIYHSMYESLQEK